MTKALKTLALSAAIGLGAIAAVPTAAMAQNGFYLGFGGGSDPRVGVWVGESGHAHRRWDRRHDRRDFRRDASTCSPGEAVSKARRMGLRNARVVDTSRNSITVRGRDRGGREFVTFGRFGRCPVIG
ncbi:MAG: hypothetical protein AB7I79_20685 [Rhizobiaceae bacterium]